MAYQTSPKKAKKIQSQTERDLESSGGKIAKSGKGDFRIKVCTQGMPLMIGVHTVSHKNSS